MNRGIQRTGQLIGVIGTLVGINAAADAATVNIDLNNDGHADILWQRGGTGDLGVWYMNGATPIGSAPLGSVVKSSSGYTCVGVGDFNNDGHVDMLWHNGVTGHMDIAFMNGVNRTSTATLDPSFNIADSSGWRVVGTADFNQDGKVDILWYQASTGALSVWYMDGATVLSFVSLDSSLNIPGTTGWRPLGAWDFDGDQMPDILWRNGQTGETQIWYMSGLARIRGQDLDSSLNVTDSSGWMLVGVDDFDNDHQLDLLWHNGQTGDTQIWTMSGLTRLSVLNLAPSNQIPDSTGWRVIDGVNQTLQASATTAPASSDPYAVRSVAMTAFNTVQTNDPTINGLGITSINVATDATGRTVRMQGTGASQFIDYYVSFPHTLEDSTLPDASYFTFDFKDSTGEIAGFQDLWSWVDPQGVTHVFSDQQVNGEYHMQELTIDSDGNVIPGSEVQAKATKRPDRCKIISDWGALQCPRSFSGPKEIPTTVQSRMMGVGFSSFVGTVWGKVKAAANYVNRVIRSPVGQYALTVLAVGAGAIVCCLTTALVACVVCIAAEVAYDAVAFGQLENGTDPLGNQTRPLQGAGVIACDDPACGSTAVCETTCSGDIGCEVVPSVAGQCPSGFSWIHGGVILEGCSNNAKTFRVFQPSASPVGGYCFYFQN